MHRAGDRGRALYAPAIGARPDELRRHRGSSADKLLLLRQCVVGDGARMIFFDLDLDSPRRFALAPEYLPIRDLSMMLDYALWGEWFGGFHLTNLLIYMAAIALWFRALQAFGIERRSRGACGARVGRAIRATPSRSRGSPSARACSARCSPAPRCSATRGFVLEGGAGSRSRQCARCGARRRPRSRWRRSRRSSSRCSRRAASKVRRSLVGLGVARRGRGRRVRPGGCFRRARGDGHRRGSRTGAHGLPLGDGPRRPRVLRRARRDGDAERNA